MLVPLLVLLKIPQNVQAANFRLRINGSWFLLKRHPRFMFSALHTRPLGGGRSLVAGVLVLASDPPLSQAGHPKATFCGRCWLHTRGPRPHAPVFAFCLMQSECGFGAHDGGTLKSSAFRKMSPLTEFSAGTWLRGKASASPQAGHFISGDSNAVLAVLVFKWLDGLLPLDMLKLLNS